jgi:hypothetical protein
MELKGIKVKRWATHKTSESIYSDPRAPTMTRKPSRLTSKMPQSPRIHPLISQSASQQANQTSSQPINQKWAGGKGRSPSINSDCAK